MGIVNLYRGLNSEKQILNFTGKLKDNLDLDWEHTEIIKNGEKLTPDYELNENEVLIIQETPGFTVTAIILGVVALAVGIGTGIYASEQAKKAKREMEEALKRIGKDNKKNDVASIPQLGDARNEMIDGKNVPLILGKHLFAPYFLSEPYLRPAGTDGEDLYWYGTFLVGQNGLCFEKIRNGSTKLLDLSGDIPQRGKFSFENPNTPDPPFYNSENYIDIAQKGNNPAINNFTDPVFEQKWVDSLDSSVEIGRNKSDNPKTGNVDGSGNFTENENGIFVSDKGDEGGTGADPIIRPTAKFPMRAEIEISFLDGLNGWDSKNGEPTDANVSVKLEWDYNINFTNPKTIITFNITRNKTQQMRFLAEQDFPADVYSKEGNPVFIRATRLTRMHTGSYRDRVYLTAIRTKQYNPNTSNTTRLIAAKNINDRIINSITGERITDKFCRMGIKLKVNKNTQEFMDRFNVVASMTGRTWNNGWSTVKTKTSNSAAVLLELITGLIHDTSKHRDQELDLRTFGKLYEYCANRSVTIAGQGRQTFTLECNGVLTSGTRKIDAIQSILATCDAGIYVNEFGKLEVYYEDYQVTPIALLNNQRLISMVDQRSLERKSDGYTVEFVDQEADWTQKTHRILRPRVEVNPGLNTYSPMKLDFTTSYNQVMWHARRLLAKEEFRPGEIKCTVGKEGRYYKPGSLIKVQNERHKIGLGSGEIIQLIRNGNQITGLKLMERFNISKGRDYWIEYYVVDENRNFVVQKQIQSVGEYTDRLMFTVPIDLNDEGDRTNAPVFGNILSTLYAEGLNTGRVWESKRYIVTDLSENQNGYDLSLAEYAEEIYSDSEIENIPERRSSILSAPPMVFSDQQRNEQQLLLDALRAQTNPQNIDRIASQVFDREFDDNIGGAVGEKAPRFRGVYYAVGTNDGKINNDKMNVNDYVYYAGSSGAWQATNIYQWTGAAWEIRAKPSTGNTAYGWMYLNAVNSIAQNAPTGVFSDVFCQALVATTAFITSLFSQQITIRHRQDPNNPNNSIIGWIQSENYSDANKTGFYLDSNGNARFYNGTIEIGTSSGTIIIDGVNRVIKSSNFVPGSSGWCLYPDGTVEFRNGVFRGDLVAGTLTATGLNISAPVTYGTTYTIRSNNIPVTAHVIGTNNINVKEIVTAAYGNVALQLQFENAVGSYRIQVNGITAIDWTGVPSNSLFTQSLSLPNNTVNRISLDIRVSGAQYSHTNTIFKIMSNTNPRFLALLG